MKSKYIEIDIENIVLLGKNPRNIDLEGLEKLKQDIKNDPEFLKQRPPLLNLVKGKQYCYAGTQRVKAAKELEYTKLFCFVEENVPEKLQDERMLKDNLHRGKWNFELLKELDFEIADKMKSVKPTSFKACFQNTRFEELININNFQDMMMLAAKSKDFINQLKPI
jgi:ParB-like chromosome segregation protein Spo0J